MPADVINIEDRLAKIEKRLALPMMLFDDRIRGRIAGGMVLQFTLIMALVLTLTLRENWNTSPFSQTVVIMVVSGEINFMMLVLGFYFASSLGSAMKSIADAARQMSPPPTPPAGAGMKAAA